MKQNKREKLEKRGYRVTDTQEFLGLSDEEIALIDLKVTLVQKVRAVREARKLTQGQVGKLIGSSQSRVAMMERGRPEVSLDLICRTLFALGLSRDELGKSIRMKRAA
ncbi:MAG TPA: helix-turn-helix transcriptional regulator [Tepidisphaeraceae bacterium]|nr:helix-turn-helix transcriptional regulator [Tepidisphaeraceae bacterium]